MHTDKGHSDEYLSGQLDFMYGDEVQVRTQTKVKNPLVINATERDDDPAALLRDAMLKHGYTKRGEWLSAEQISARLQEAGFDGVEVRQKEYNDDIAGSQIAVFDPKNVRIRPELKPERVIRLKQGDKKPPSATPDRGLNYIKMHGLPETKRKLAALKAKKKPTARDQAMIADLQSAIRRSLGIRS